MISRSTGSNLPPAVPALDEKSPDLPASPPVPLKAGDREPVEQIQSDADRRPEQPWRHISEEERRARHEEYQRRLAEIDAEDDTPEEVYDEIMRNLEKAHDYQPAEWPYRDIDPRTGRLRPISDEEWRARMEELTRLLAEIDAADDTPEEVYDEIERNIDEERRRQGRPPVFEGCD